LTDARGHRFLVSGLPAQVRNPKFEIRNRQLVAIMPPFRLTAAAGGGYCSAIERSALEGWMRRCAGRWRLWVADAAGGARDAASAGAGWPENAPAWAELCAPGWLQPRECGTRRGDRGGFAEPDEGV